MNNAARQAKAKIAASVVGALFGSIATAQVVRSIPTPSAMFVGSVSATFEVNGAAGGSTTQTERFTFRHNRNVTVLFSGFGDPIRVDGPLTTDDLHMFLEVDAPRAGFSFAGPASNLNGQAIQAFLGSTGGGFDITFTRHIDVARQTRPGVYRNVGRITISGL